jgi:hypothetical protein
MLMANDRLGGGRWRSGADGPRDPDRTKDLEGIADDLVDRPDYQIGPDAVRPDEAHRTETGTAHRGEEAAGVRTDGRTLGDAERAFRINKGETPPTEE